MSDASSRGARVLRFGAGRPTAMLSIVIPCHNEAENVGQVAVDLLPVAALLASTRPVEIVFVNDGSTDHTQSVFESLCAYDLPRNVQGRVVAHRRNLGLGAALRTGFGAATGSIIVTTDCDATYRFQEIPALLSRLTDDMDVVTASPYHPDGGVADVPQYRLILSRGSSWIYRRLVGRHVHTYTALFRAYRRSVLEQVPFSSNGFLAGTEILVNAMRAGYGVAEYPTVLHARVRGVSKARLARTIMAHLTFQFRILWASLSRRARWVTEQPARARPALRPAGAAAAAGGGMRARGQRS
jgi:dolichol-phosphate mannosyltransferase